MRIITLNVNGIRAAESKGLGRWLARTEAWDVVCLQEIKAHVEAVPKTMLGPRRSTAVYLPAEKPGYAGVATFTQHPAERVVRGFGSREFDPEGRYLQLDFPRASIVSVYLPSGSSSEARQQAKFRFLDEFLPHLRRLREGKREVVLCGDWNIAHQPIDLKNWRANQKNSGFLPEERAWLSRVFEELGYVDVFRRLNKAPDQYTWWSNRGQAWSKNVGWRIDYQIATPGLAETATSVSIYKTRRFSDHAPLIVDYDFPLA